MVALIDSEKRLAVFEIEKGRLIQIFSEKEFSDCELFGIMADFKGRVWVWGEDGIYGRVN